MSLEENKKLFRQEAKFIAGVSKINQFPKLDVPEVAFIGKSNVGKSSLINLICNRRNLARVSHTPGRTQQINFFSLIEKLTIVDLPGYGFAKVPARIKNEWEKLIVFYLQNRNNLKLVNLLIDGRHGIKDADIDVMKLLIQYERKFQIVFTKIDKASGLKELETSSQNLLATLPYSCNVLYTSNRSKQGAKELQFNLAKFAK